MIQKWLKRVYNQEFAQASVKGDVPGNLEQVKMHFSLEEDFSTFRHPKSILIFFPLIQIETIFC